MGLLSQDYFDTLAKEPASVPTSSVPTSTAVAPVADNSGQPQPQPSPLPPSVPTPVTNPSPFDAYIASIRNRPGFTAPGVPAGTPVTAMRDPELTPEEQAQRFGGAVGSEAYFQYKADHPYTSFLGPQLLSSVGINLPNQEEWDKMSRKDQGINLAAAGVGAVASMFMNLPKAIVRNTASVGLTAIKPFYNLATGKSFSPEALGNEPKVSAPWVGEIPTLYQDKVDAEKSGMGPIASILFAGGNTVLNAAGAMPLADILSATFRPRGNTNAPGVIENTAPITVARQSDGVAVNKIPSTSEYYTLRKSDAKQFGGNPQTVQWKFTPAAEGETSLSVVRQLPKNTKVGSWIKTDFGLKQVSQGDFGPEVKLYSHNVPTGTKGMTGASGSADFSKIDLPSRADPGFEMKPINPKQMETLNQIGAAKGMDSVLRDTVIKTLSGKQVIGEMTQKQFIDVAQSLSKFGEQYGATAAKLGPVGYVRSILSPQRHYFDYAEDTFGIPLKSQVYNPMEDAARLSKTLQSSMQTDLQETFGQFAQPKYSGERKLIDSYARGNPEAITANESLTPEMKASLIETAKKIIAWDEKNGTVLNVGKEAYLEHYGGPKIANISGTVPKYKDLNTFPVKTFFAKEKREGSLDAYIDDPLASRQIYVKQGADALHFGPALENIKPMLEAVPHKQLKDSAMSYIQEKLGYQGHWERAIDSIVPALNAKMAKFGVELPADASRQMVNYGLSSLYSGLVGTPSAMFKQMFQYPLFVYPKLGSEFSGEALIKSMNSAERDRVANGGWLNDVSLPYGEELTKDFNPVGRAANAFKTGTQMTLKPMTFVDNDIRIKTFLQGEMQWNAALNKFNAGTMDWPTLESKLDFGSFSKADRDAMRQALIKKDNVAAFNIFMRETLDETSFPYRRGSGARVGYGLSGKLSTGLLNYTIESSNVLGRWLARGQFDKLIRFAGSAKTVNDTLSETMGMNFGDTLYQKFQGLESPVVGLVANTYNYLNSLSQNNRKDMNASRDQIIRTLKSGLPLGVETRNAGLFWKSINAGPDAQGNYGVYDDAGRLTYSSDFSDLFWGTLMGFPTNTKVGERTLHTDLLNAQTEQAEIKQQLDQMLREGKYDDMEKLIEKTGVTPSQGAMQKYYVPRNQALFDTLPNNAKPDFIPRVFPDETASSQ